MEVDVTGGSKTFTYDANGNLTSDGTRTFEWDARNQLIAVSFTTHRTEFTYDGLQRRIRAIEKENGVAQSDTRVVWCQVEVCEERATDGTTVTRRELNLGEQINGQLRYLTTDHLGSGREVTNSTGGLSARYEFDPWGRRTLSSGSDVTMSAFTGHRLETASGILNTLFRAYDVDLGRWINEDPAGLSAGSNLYSYANENPLSHRDPLGLMIACVSSRVQESFVGVCPPGKTACTRAAMRIRNPEPCRPNPGCGTWGFNVTVDLTYDITYLRPKYSPSGDTPGATLEQHEWLHIGDLQSWCTRLSRDYPSEGFSSLSQCTIARDRFYKDVQPSFQKAETETRLNRDRP